MNNKKLKLAFTWHMHQPYYKDDISNTTHFPWVFLHSIKDYYDLLWYSKRFNIKSTFNLVPSLIKQIKSYINNSANDILLETIKKDINSIDDKDKTILQSYLFLSNEKNMIKPFKRYYELYLKYNSNNKIFDFKDDEILDLEVLFLLSWCGNHLRSNNQVVSELIDKQRYFTHYDKIRLIEELQSFLKQILPYYKKCENDGLISIATTPYYHPITPLLLDINSANEARVDVILPKNTSSFKEFGVKNTQDAVKYYENIFSKKPTGFWPAEGSVSYKTLELFASNGIKWFCTDQEVLFKTLNNFNIQNIYKNYSINIDDKTIDARFRDHSLSDAIGFEYSNKDPKESALDFINRLEKIYQSCDFNPLVNVILDGENAWEFFPNNAEDFFVELYTLINNTPWIETITNDEISNNQDIKTEKLNTIASGSWINGNFDIWIGQKDKNKAWELLDITKQQFDKLKNNLDEETIKKIEDEFMQALGSDWFWWYGDDHFTLEASKFDDLFRIHLINIFNLLNCKTPNEILIPIVKNDKKNKFHIKPTNYIYPIIDGSRSDYFEWLNCGYVDLKKELSVMDSSKSLIDNFKYGYHTGKLYFLFEFDINKHIDLNLELYIDQEKYSFKLKDGVQNIIYDDNCMIINIDGNTIEIEYTSKKISIENSVNIKFELFISNQRLQLFPMYDSFTIDILDLDLNNWYV